MSVDHPHRWTPEPNGLCRYCGQVERICPGICKPPADDTRATAQQRTVPTTPEQP